MSFIHHFVDSHGVALLLKLGQYIRTITKDDNYY